MHDLNFRLSSRPLRQRIEGLARRTSVAEASHDLLVEPRTRVARAGITTGIAVASSDVTAICGLRALRTPVGPQIVLA